MNDSIIRARDWSLNKVLLSAVTEVTMYMKLPLIKNFDVDMVKQYKHIIL